MASKRLELLIQTAKAIAAEFGKDCEIVIHDLSNCDIDSSVVYIENGHISGREIGSGPSKVVLEVLKSKNKKNIQDKLSYLTQTEDGHILKSSTVFVKDDDENVKYILAINLDITNFVAFSSSIESIVSTKDENKDPKKIPLDVNNLLDDLLQQSIKVVGKPVSMMTKKDKIKAIKFLNDSGAFLITKSGDKASQFFGISKYTLYSYVEINKPVDKNVSKALF